MTLLNLAGGAQPYFESPGGGGSAGLLKALRTDEGFRDEVASGDIIVISTGQNDGGEGEPIEEGPCDADERSCVSELERRWHQDSDDILTEIEELRAGEPTAIRLVNAANAFNDPSFDEFVLSEWDAFFEALTEAMCAAAEAHVAVCVSTCGPRTERPGLQPTGQRQFARVDGRRR